MERTILINHVDGSGQLTIGALMVGWDSGVAGVFYIFYLLVELN